MYMLLKKKNKKMQAYKKCETNGVIIWFETWFQVERTMHVPRKNT